MQASDIAVGSHEGLADPEMRRAEGLRAAETEIEFVPVEGLMQGRMVLED